MFTGIIQSQGRISQMRESNKFKSIEIESNLKNFSISAAALRSVLDGVAGRLDESREISRYLIGLLIFLGLLGTFWGLIGTVCLLYTSDAADE